MGCYICEERSAVNNGALTRMFDAKEDILCMPCAAKLRNLGLVFEEGMVIELPDGREVHITVHYPKDKFPNNRVLGQVSFT